MSFDFGIDVDEESKKEGPGGDFAPLPPGEYEVIVSDVEFKITKAGTGEYLNASFQIIGDAFAGRLFFHIFNTSNPNPRATEIGLRELAKCAKACGVEGKLDKTAALGLRGKALRVKVNKKYDDYRGAETNKIIGFLPKTPMSPLPPATDSKTGTVLPDLEDIPF